MPRPELFSREVFILRFAGGSLLFPRHSYCDLDHANPGMLPIHSETIV